MPSPLNSTAFRAEDVYKLREKTDEPLMACKRAMMLANGDMTKAEDILRDSSRGHIMTRPKPLTEEQVEQVIGLLKSRLTIRVKSTYVNDIHVELLLDGDVISEASTDIKQPSSSW